MNKKSINLILPRWQIQDRRNVFEGCRAVAVLETIQHSEEAHAMWVSHMRDQESTAAIPRTHAKALYSERNREKTHPARLSQQLKSARHCRDRYLCRKSLPVGVTAPSKCKVLMGRIKEKASTAEQENLSLKST